MRIFSAQSLRAIGLTLFMTVVPPVTWADTVPAYIQLLDRLDAIPDTVEANALHEAALARAEQAAARPNPTLSLESEGAFGSGAYAGYGGADTTVAVSQPLDLWGQRKARMEAAQATAEAARLRSDMTRLTVAGRLAAAYAEAEAAQRRYALAAEALSLAQADANAAEIFVDEGREARLSLIQAASEVARAQADLDEAQANRNAAFAYLSAFALLAQPAATITDSLLNKIPAAHSLEPAHSPGIRVAQAELDATRHLVTVETLRARPDVTATLGVQRFEETHDEALMLGVSVTVPLFDNNKGNIRAAQAEQRAAEARLRARNHEDFARRQAAQARLTTANSRTQAADNSVAAAQEAYQLARLGFEAGRIAPLELRSTRAALNMARKLAVDARLARVYAEIELAALEGRVPFEGI